MVLELEAEQLGDILPLIVFKQSEIGSTIPKVVLKRVKDDVEYSIRVNIEVANESFNVSFDRLDIRQGDVALIELNYQLGKTFILLT